MSAADPPPDAGSFEDFYAAARSPCLRAVLAITLDTAHAEDHTAEAFTRALERWDDVRHHPAPAAWVVRTATNLHLDRRRSSTRLVRLLPALLDRSPQVVEDVDLTLDRTLDPHLLAVLRTLPPRQRETLALRVLLGLSGTETAEHLGISPGSVGTHLHRALTALRDVAARPDEPGAVDPAGVPPTRSPRLAPSRTHSSITLGT